MKRNSTVLFTGLIVLFFSLLLPSTGRAQNWYEIAQCKGIYSIPGVGTTQVSTNVSKAYYASTGLTSTWGSMKVLTPTLFGNSTVLSAAFSWVTVFGVSVQHAILVSQSFNYYPPLSQTSFPAHLLVTLTQLGAYGQGSYRLISDVDGSIISQSTANGVYAEVMFAGPNSYVVITE